MGILNNINTIREQLRKRQDKTLALKSKAARDEISIGGNRKKPYDPFNL